MKTNLAVFIFLILSFYKSNSQINDFEKYYKKGIELYDNGDYEGSVEQYKNALKLDEKSTLVNYEIATAYFSLKNYQKAIEHSEAVISQKKEYVDRAYVVKGSALDLMGKTKDAIKAYKKAVKDYPESNLLNYNLALTCYNIKEYKDAEAALQEALRIKPTHGSSHLLMAYVMSDQNNRVKSLLALYNFLLVEPKGKRAEAALDMLEKFNKKGVSVESEKKINITLSSDTKDDEFRAAEFMISMLEASKSLETNENKSQYELFTGNTKSFFTILGELKKDNKGFWWNYYVGFLYDLASSDHMEAYSYYITQSKNDEKITVWLNDNKVKVDALLKWVSLYKRKV